MQRHLMWGLPVIAAMAVLAVIAAVSTASDGDVHAALQATDTPTPTATLASPTATATASPATGTPTGTLATGTASPRSPTGSPTQPAAVPVTGGEPGSSSLDLALVIALAAGAIAGVAGLFAVSYSISRRS